MGLKRIFELAALSAAVFATSALKPESVSNKSFADIAPIEKVGQKFFNSKTGDQFFLKGVAYQPTKITEAWNADVKNTDTKYVDPLAEISVCLRDIPYFKELGINTLRVYAINPRENHDACMSALADAGIYVLLDLSEPDNSIQRSNPTWDIKIWNRYISVVDAMERYPNVLGFFAGNEVTSDDTNTEASPFVKAAIRDLKSYIGMKGYRKIPVGYSSNDDAFTRQSLAQYFVCGDEASADFYGINMYEWCGYSSYGTSGYKERTEEFLHYPIPVFFSEFGCNSVRPRPFTEVSALFGPKMSKVWSGGLAYMYFEEENGYGLVKINEYGTVDQLEDFQFLQNEFRKANPKGVRKERYLKESRLLKTELFECPVATEDTEKIWKASTNIPPSPSPEKCRCLEDVLPCLVTSFDSGWDYQQYFDYACSQVDCSDISVNGEEGLYGEFSDCLPEQKLALEISKMYRIRDHPTGLCPMSGRNVFFNTKSLTVTDAVCVKVADRLRDLLVPSSRKSSGTKKLLVPKVKDTNATNQIRNAGSSFTTRSQNLGYALLCFSVIFATIVF
ncbi:related to 1,3-beta-glucanosyltransferase GAS2 [Zygosaccharomyces bailii]|nr:related to 1,3-beta-glucanosyltransferase GAS2 [Zygosaccharomyces bailii]